MQLGFIGLGALGSAVAMRLMERQHTLTAWNRTSARAEKLGLSLAASPKAVAETTEIIFLCLFDSAAVRQVLSGEDGLLAGASGSTLIIDLTTNHYRDAEAFHRLCQGTGVAYLECPVLGSVVPASQGALTLLCGGALDAYQRAEPILRDIGQNLFHFGEPGQATRMKLINNLTLGGFMAALAEATALAEHSGIPKDQALDILGVGGGQSLVLNAKRAKLLNEDFSPHFSNALIYKDLHCLQDLAYDLKHPLHTAAVTKELYARTYQQGFENEDFSAIYKLFKRKP